MKSKANKIPNGAILWQGPSPVDGKPIVAIAVKLKGKTTGENRKTGAMVQTYILRSDVHPSEALATGRDASVCGACPLRPQTTDGIHSRERVCYVQHNGIGSVYRAFRRGAYPVTDPATVGEWIAGRPVRLGSYGDPAMIPAEVWRALLAHASRWTGYTHQWARPFARPLQSLCMASVETPALAGLAESLGWRVFRVRRSTDAVRANETICPASKEGGNKTQCARCGLCNGAGPRKASKSIAIIAHGSGRGAYERLIDRMIAQESR